MTHVPHETVSLAAGAMPLLGFGTWQITGPDAVTATAAALETGYRHLDTATVYDNEAEVGRALADSGVPREDVFVTTKCPPERIGREQQTLEQSLENLRTDYLDLWLIHWTVDSADDRRAVWEAFIAAQEEGLVRDIGVSNYSPAQIDELVEATGVTPAVNQIELHPRFPQQDMLAVHERLSIRTEAWSPMGKRRAPLDEDAVTAAARAHDVTPGQVILRWHVQRGSLPIPKSADPERQRQNLDVFGFELSADQVSAITALGEPDGRLFGGDPDTHEEM
jgi:diketogulonate reductase-like aldo/keto reductase